MWLSVDALPGLVAASAAVCVASLWLSRRRTAWWYLDPRGPFAVILFLHASGVPIFALWHGRLPQIFGLVPSRVADATGLTVLFQCGILLGTLLPARFGRSAAWELRPETQRAFFRVLEIAVFLTDTPAWLGLASGGYARLAHAHYGEGQGLEGSDWMAKVTGLSNISYIAIPTLALLVLAHGLARRPLSSPRLVGLVAWVAIPVLLSGGRRDLVILLAAFFLARAVRSVRPKWGFIAVAAVALTLLSMVLAASRSGDSLSPSDRLQAVRDMNALDSASALDAFLLLFSSTNVISGAVCIFPTPHSFTLGSSYFQASATLLYPGFLMGGYLYEPMSWQFRELYYPSIHGLAIDYSIVAEAYQNFGMVGPFGVGCVTGAALNALFTRSHISSAQRFSPWPMLNLHVLWTTVYALRTDSNTYAKLLVYGTLWLFGLAGVAALMNRGVARMIPTAAERKQIRHVRASGRDPGSEA